MNWTNVTYDPDNDRFSRSDSTVKSATDGRAPSSLRGISVYTSYRSQRTGLSYTRLVADRPVVFLRHTLPEQYSDISAAEYTPSFLVHGRITATSNKTATSTPYPRRPHDDRH